MSRSSHWGLKPSRLNKTLETSQNNLSNVEEFVQSNMVYPTIQKNDKQRFQVNQKQSKIPSKLPNISEILNKETRILQTQYKETLLQIAEYAQELENQNRTKSKEIEKLLFLNKFLEISALKKEEMIKNLQKQIYDLKDQIHQMEMKNKPTTVEPRSPQNQKQPVLNHPPINILKQIELTHQRSTPSLGKEVYRAQNMPRSKMLSRNQPTKFLLNSSMFLPLQNSKSINSFNESPIQSALGSRRHIDLMEDIKKSDFISQRFGPIINLEMNQEEVMQILNEFDAFQYLKEQYFEESNNQKQSKYNNSNNEDIEAIKKLEEESTKDLISCSSYLIKLIIRLKQVIRATINLDSSLGLNKSLERIIDLACISLKCQRSSVFILDQVNCQLWSTAAKGMNKIIKIPSHVGVIGHAVQNIELVNIPNAYIDQRFDKSADMVNGFITKTILANPLIEKNQCIGVIQGINKLDGNVFNKEDEEFIKLISRICSNILKQTVIFDQQYTVYNKLRHIIVTSIQLVDLNAMQEVIKRGEIRLKDMLNSENARIYLFDQKNSIFYIDENGENISFPYGTGVAGRSIKYTEKIFFTNLQDHEDYNPKIDLDSDMPGIAFPIQHEKLRKTLGCFQITSNQVYDALGKNTQGKYFVKDQEILGFFSFLIGEYMRKFWVQEGAELEYTESNMIAISIN